MGNNAGWTNDGDSFEITSIVLSGQFRPAAVALPVAPTLGAGTLIDVDEVEFAISGGSNFTVLAAEYREAGASQWTVHNASIPINSVVYPFNGLSGDMTYEFRLAAYGPGGVAYSNIGTQTTPEIPPVVAPTITATTLSSQRIDVAFSGGSNYTTLTLQRALASGNEWTTVAIVSTSPYSVTGLSPATEYKFRILADGAGGSVYSNVATATTNTAGSPSGSEAHRITGSNFGMKPTPEPFFFQPFLDTVNGQLPSQVGFTSYVNHGAEKVVMSDGVGGGSIRCDPGPTGSDNAQPHIGVYLPTGNQRVRCSFWLKVYGNSASVLPFFKTFRCGTRSGAGPVEDYNSELAKFYPRMNLHEHGIAGENSHMFEARTATVPSYAVVYPDETGWGNVPNLPQPAVDFKQWQHVEGYFYLNTLGAANGGGRLTTRNHRLIQVSGLQLKTLSYEDLSYIQPITHLEGAGDAYDWAMSRVYIDVGPYCLAGICRINAPTAAGATGIFDLVPTYWSDTLVEWDPDSDVNVPAGYDWVKVTNSNGVSQVFHKPVV